MSGSKPKAAPAVAYKGPVIVDPVTRIEGHLRIVTQVENGKVVDVQSSAQLFRGLEIILKGRDPRDAQHFTSAPAASAPTCTPWAPPAAWRTRWAWTRSCPRTRP